MSDQQFRRTLFSAEPGTLHEKFIRALEGHIRETGQRMEAKEITGVLGTMMLQIWCLGIEEDERGANMAEWLGLTSALATKGLKLLADEKLQDAICRLHEAVIHDQTRDEVEKALANVFASPKGSA